MAGSARNEEVGPFPDGTIVGGRYRVGRRIGRGGMGAVYEAVHVGTRQPVAVKVLLEEFTDNEVAVRRFLREARAAATIDHPNAIQVTDVFQDDTGVPVIVMELLAGRNLAARLDREGTLSIDEAAAILVPVLGALATAHAKGIVHRDLKPDNVFLAEKAGVTVPKLLDFGIAKVFKDVTSDSAHLTNTGSLLGTPHYMSPEQASGKTNLDHRSDLWSMGVILFEVLTGKLPFDGDNFGQVLAAILQDDAPDLRAFLPGAPPAIAALVERCLAKKPAQRVASAGDVANALAPFASLPAAAYPAPKGAELGADASGPHLVAKTPNLDPVWTAHPTLGAPAAEPRALPETLARDDAPRHIGDTVAVGGGGSPLAAARASTPPPGDGPARAPSPGASSSAGPTGARRRASRAFAAAGAAAVVLALAAVAAGKFGQRGAASPDRPHATTAVDPPAVANAAAPSSAAPPVEPTAPAPSSDAVRGAVDTPSVAAHATTRATSARAPASHPPGTSAARSQPTTAAPRASAPPKPAPSATDTVDRDFR